MGLFQVPGVTVTPDLIHLDQNGTTGVNPLAPLNSPSCLLLMQNQYNLARAQQSYKSLVQIHEKNGESCPADGGLGGGQRSWTLVLDPGPGPWWRSLLILFVSLFLPVGWYTPPKEDG